MDNKLRVNSCMLTCCHCKKRYDMSALSKEAEIKGRCNLYCPQCGQKVGTLQ